MNTALPVIAAVIEFSYSGFPVIWFDANIELRLHFAVTT